MSKQRVWESQVPTGRLGAKGLRTRPGTIVQLTGCLSEARQIALRYVQWHAKRGGKTCYLDWSGQLEGTPHHGAPLTHPRKVLMRQPPDLQEGLFEALVALEQGVDLFVFDALSTGWTGIQKRPAWNRDRVWKKFLPSFKRTIREQGSYVIALGEGPRVWPPRRDVRIHVERGGDALVLHGGERLRGPKWP